MKRFLSFAGSLKLTLIVLTVIIIVSTVGTFMRQEEANKAIYHSWWFAILLLILVLNLGICTFRRIRPLRFRQAGFLCVHLGVIAVLAGVVVGGIGGIQGIVVIGVGQETSTFQGNDKKKYKLPFTVSLEDFLVEHYNYGKVLVMAPGMAEPLSFPVIVGKKYRMEQFGFNLEILKYIPDYCEGTTRSFQPRNPAVQICIDGDLKVWLFRDFGMPHPPKKPLPFKLHYQWTELVSTYRSTVKVTDPGGSVREAVIEVNKPFEHKRYSLYQLNYDRAHHRYTVLEVVTDPGLEIVYAGFVLIILGVIFILYLKPALKKRAAKEKAS